VRSYSYTHASTSALKIPYYECTIRPACKADSSYDPGDTIRAYKFPEALPSCGGAQIVSGYQPRQHY
jgi:hypothetical protein